MSDATATADAPATETSAPEISGELKQVADTIAGLTLKDAVALKDYLKAAYGIEPAAGAVAVAGPAGGGAAAVERSRRRPASTSCSRASATRRWASSRPSARSPAWA